MNLNLDLHKCKSQMKIIVIHIFMKFQNIIVKNIIIYLL